MLKVLGIVFFVLVIIRTDVFIKPVQGDGQTYVRVENQIGFDVEIHCQSSANNVGTKHLGDKQSLEWVFGGSTGHPTSIYYCAIKFNALKRSLFTAYDPKLDQGVCASNCLRQIRPDGGYFFHEYTNSWEKRYQWA